MPNMMLPTGYSDKPIDFGRASQAMLHSALQMKLADIKKQEGDLSETQKFITKAMDINTLPGMAGAMQSYYQKKISDFRDKVLKTTQDAYNKRGGLSIQDKVDIEGGSVALQNEMKRGVLNLKEMGNLQKEILDSKNGNIDRNAAMAHWGQMSERIKKGEDVSDDISGFRMSHYVPDSEEKMVQKGMTPALKEIGRTGSLKNKNGILYTESQNDIDAVGGAIEDTFKNNPNLAKKIAKINPVDGSPVTDGRGKIVFDPDKLKEIKDQYVPKFLKKSETPHVPKKEGGSKDSTTTDEGFTSFGSNQYTHAVKVGSTSGVPERSIKGAKLDDGTEVTDENPRQYNAIAVSLKDGKPVINIAIKGGEKERGGKPLFKVGSGEYTEDELDYSKEAKDKAGKDFKIQGAPKVVKKGNGYELQYDMIKPANTHLFKANEPEEKKTVSFPLDAVKDNTKQTWATIPWNNFNKGLLSKADRQKKLSGTDKTVEQYFDEVAKSSLKSENTQPQPQAQSKVGNLYGGQ